MLCVKVYYESWGIVTFGIFIFHLKKIDRILTSKTWYVHGTRCPKFQISLRKASLGYPSFLVGQARKPVFNNPTPLIEKTWVTLC